MIKISAATLAALELERQREFEARTALLLHERAPALLRGSSAGQQHQRVAALIGEAQALGCESEQQIWAWLALHCVLGSLDETSPSAMRARVIIEDQQAPVDLRLARARRALERTP